MTIIITMAGLGTRFKKAGFDCPKYMIEAKGKTLFEWSLDSLLDFNRYVTKYVFVARREDCASHFIIEKCKNYGIENVEVIEIEQKTDGQATTCMLAIPHCKSTEEIFIYNIDTYVEPYEMKYKDISGDGHMPCFVAEGEHWSFVRLDNKGKAVEVREKVRISDNCTIGAYYFSSARLFENTYKQYYAEDLRMESGEKYIAPLYNYLINKGHSVSISLINPKKVHVLGTPEELNAFMEA